MRDVLVQITVFVIWRLLYILEAAAVAVLIWLALRHPRAGAKWFREIELRFAALVRRRRTAVIVAGLVPMILRALLLPLLPPRLPAIADDFAYVLAGETFAAGKLANPPHPMWAYFESPHVLQQPTYASMYFPAQGFFLALGKAVAGNLWAGVWLSVGLMCAAICWMLQGWLPPRWALLGALLAGVRLGLFSYWMNSYYGGAVAALGGALVLGALPRIMRKRSVPDSCWLALGLAILANSRPFEGLLLAAPVAVYLIYVLLRERARWRALVPMMLLLIGFAGMTSYDYWRVTGDPLKMPQALQREAYAVAPYFIWQSPQPQPAYRHAALRGFYAGEEMKYFEHARSHWFAAALRKIADFWLFYLGPVLTLPLLALPLALRSRRLRFLGIAASVFVLGLCASIWFYPHYAAPATALLYALLMQSIRHLRVWKWRGEPAGLLLARGIPVICLAMLVARLCTLHLPFPPDLPSPTWYSTQPGDKDRAAILKRLHDEGGKHLVLVRWKEGDNAFNQWVYNEPDIDRAQVVWAWETDRPADLLNYYRDRKVWLVWPQWHGPPEFSEYAGVGNH